MPLRIKKGSKRIVEEQSSAQAIAETGRENPPQAVSKDNQDANVNSQYVARTSIS